MVSLIYKRADAHISADEKHRYWLERRWSEDPEARAFIVVGLNPSTADARQDDPTIRRCVGFAHRLGYGRLVMLNLYSFRSTTPLGLYRQPDAARNGPEAEDTLCAFLGGAVGRGDTAVAAWGAQPKAEARAAEVFSLAEAFGVTLHCLSVTADGSPRHPLYLRSETPLEVWQRVAK